MPTVRPATAADLPTIGRVLAAAFEDDPVWSWLASKRAHFLDRAATWFEADARAMLRGHGEVLVDDEGRGAAIWTPPGHWKGTAREGLAVAIPSLRLFRGNILRSIANLQRMEKLHPQEPPHWYLAILGTDPNHQGRGIGSALITTMTERCDELGLGAYLESSKEANLAFYAHHGFEVRTTLELPDGPRMWTMWREPKA